ncbi:hypothetical protein [Streptomyces sp. NPDC012450]|uniref:hypothetical protein n=1 Tax=Streptomyces sp. NPDC012450 TaxID=3364834 RepID=UPI0036F0AEF1
MTARRVRAGTAVLGVVMALTATGCSGGGAPDGAEKRTAAALKVCEEVFGAGGVAEAREVLDSSRLGAEPPVPGGFRAEGRDLDGIRTAMTGEARAYVPRSPADRRGHPSYRPCGMAAGDYENHDVVCRIGGEVTWLSLTADELADSADYGNRSNKVAEDLYARQDGGTVAVLPCRVPGAPAAQERGMPLEVRVRAEMVGPEADLVIGRLLASLVRDTRERLGCLNPVEVPATFPFLFPAD